MVWVKSPMKKSMTDDKYLYWKNFNENGNDHVKKEGLIRGNQLSKTNLFPLINVGNYYSITNRIKCYLNR